MKDKSLIKLLSGLLLFIIARFTETDAIRISMFASSYIILGYEVIGKALNDVFKRKIFDENFLMTAATLGAVALGQYSEAVAVMLLYDAGEYLQDKTSDISLRSIEKLMEIEPEIARIINEDGSESDCNPKEIKKGDRIHILSGDRIPADGTIIDGGGITDTKAITGESIPVHVKKGDKVVSGSILIEGSAILLSETDYCNSTVNKIIELTESNKKSKAKSEKFITRFAKIYTPVVTGFAVLLAILPSLATGMWRLWIYRSLSFLVISCPCALIISVPLAFFAGTGKCASNGILIKGGTYLELLAKSKQAAFDKTGTMTDGLLHVTQVTSYSDLTEDKIISLMYSLEKNSRHPVSRAIIKYAEEKKIDQTNAEDITETSGIGMKGIINGKTYYAGGIRSIKGDFTPSENTGTIVYLSDENSVLGTVNIRDSVKENASEAISELRKLGIQKTYMLSGDRKANADIVAKASGIDDVYADLMPQDKVHVLKEIMNSGPTLYTGDGINDAPVLAASDVGIAMGKSGSAIAVESAGVVIMNDDLLKIPMAVKTAKKTVRKARENITFAIIVKIACMILGALGITGMETAVFADTGVSLLCILNSMTIFISRRQ